MLTLMVLGVVGWQQPPTIAPPAPKPQMDRRVPPPIPQPPSATPPTPKEQPPVAQDETPAPIQPAPAPVRVVRHIFLQQHDINRDGRLSPGELERRFAKQFVFADVNGDGLLDANEILHDRKQLGRSARRIEGLDLDRDGRLVFKSDKPPLPIADIARGVIDALDPNRDGFIERREIGDAVTREVLPRVGARLSGGEPIGAPESVPDAPNALPTRRVAPPPIPTPPTTNNPAPNADVGSTNSPGPTGQGSPVSSAKKDDLPSAEAMIVNLDKDGDGLLSQNETVDQLAKNFKTLDRNRDGKLDKDEIERGLRLARMFGIKPMRPPAEYGKGSATKDRAPPK